MHVRWKSLVAAVLAVVIVLVSSTEAHAAGVTTHAWMGLNAVDLVTNPDLHALLDANRGQVEGGAQFPDSGYINSSVGTPGGDYGEEAHWQRFYDAYADRIRSDPACIDLTAPHGPCAPEVAHLMGMAAHGMGDEVWDWLFEPTSPDHGEQFLPPELSAVVKVGGIEFQMDMIAIADHGRPTSPDTPALPNVPDLVASFAALGRPDITAAGLGTGKSLMGVLRAGEGGLAPTYASQVEAAMPWTSAHMITAPGGVDFAARAIAAEYENLWGRLLGDQPATRVSVTYPADGQTDVPTTGWDRASFDPGSHPEGGGARNRIAAALTYSRPYVADAADATSHIVPQLPDGAMTLVVDATGVAVPLKDGYPKSVPYSPDAGEHVLDIQPAADLTPCTTYRVAVTNHLIDANQRPVVPTSWTFRTDGCPADPGPSTPGTGAPTTTGPTTTAPSTTNVGTAVSPAVVARPVAAVPVFTG